MKKYLAIILAAALSLLVSCENSDPVREALLKRNDSLPAPSAVSYDPVESSSTVLSIYWDAEAALEHGAIHFEIQASTDEYFFDGEGSTLISKTLAANASPNDAVMLSGVSANEEYFVRVSAVYPGPARSEWSFICASDGTPVAVVPGKGPVR